MDCEKFAGEFFSRGPKAFVMDQRFKVGALTGAVFAGIAYLWASFNGFNSSTFIPMLYLYVVLGAVSRLQIEDIGDYWNELERIMIVDKEEESRLKKPATGEEYRIDGTVKKIGDQ